MRSVCCICKKHICDKEPLDNTAVTHGLCIACLEDEVIRASEQKYGEDYIVLANILKDFEKMGIVLPEKWFMMDFKGLLVLVNNTCDSLGY